MSITKVPGLKSEHQIIAPSCREDHGDFGAFDMAVAKLRYAYRTYLPMGNNRSVKFHLVLTIDHEEETDATR